MSASAPSPSATPPSTQKTIEKRRIAELKPHPLQPAYFPADPTDNIEHFAETLKRGLDNPVEITPDGIIVCGHRRTAAAKLLGWTEIDCWVRHDLAEKGAVAIEERFLEDNLERRQLGKLAIARCYQRLRAIADEEWRAGRRDRADLPRGDTRDFIGQRLGLSGRTLDRLLNILRAPQPVQDAFERDELPLVMAEKVARLPTDVQNQLAKEIEAGNSATQIVAAKLKADTERKADYGVDRAGVLSKWHRHLFHLRNEIPFLKAHIAALPRPSTAAGQVIDDAIDFLLQLKKTHEETSTPDICPASAQRQVDSVEQAIRVDKDTNGESGVDATGPDILSGEGRARPVFIRPNKDANGQLPSMDRTGGMRSHEGPVARRNGKVLSREDL